MLLVQSTVFHLAAQDPVASVVAVLLERSSRAPHVATHCVVTPLAPPLHMVAGPLTVTAITMWAWLLM